MKKIFFPLIVAAAFCLTATSCTKEEYLQSVQTYVYQTTVKNANWMEFNGNSAESPYLEAEIPVDAITRHVIENGNVNVYVWVNNKFFPLPYTMPIKVTYSDGSEVQVIEDMSFYVKPSSPGYLYLIIRDMDSYLPEGEIADITFKIVVTSPVTYIIEQ